MEQQLLRAVTHKKKKSKRIPMVAAALLTLSLGAGQAYAALNGYDNVWALIQSIFGKTEGQVVATTGTDMGKLETDFTKEVGQLVNSKVDKAIEDVNQHEKSEIDRAKTELGWYKEEVAAELDAKIKTETDQMKQTVTEKVNQDVAAAKDAMRDEVEAQLQTRDKGNGK